MVGSDSRWDELDIYFEHNKSISNAKTDWDKLGCSSLNHLPGKDRGLYTLGLYISQNQPLSGKGIKSHRDHMVFNSPINRVNWMLIVQMRILKLIAIVLV